MKLDMPLYIIRYSNRHGNDVWPIVSCKNISEEDVIQDLREDDQWEDRHDEFIEIYGPFNSVAEWLGRLEENEGRRENK